MLDIFSVWVVDILEVNHNLSQMIKLALDLSLMLFVHLV